MTHPLVKTICGFLFKKWYLTLVTTCGEVVVFRYRTDKKALSVGDKYFDAGRIRRYVVMYNMRVV